MEILIRRLPALLLLALAACTRVPNLHQVDAKVWRSGQPPARSFDDLHAQGFRDVLSLRRFHSDTAADKNGIRPHHVRMVAHDLNDRDMARAVGVLARQPGPILVHCFHGSDRTGAVVALYRMAVHDVPRETAIAELCDPRFGHHQDIFPNVREYLENVDIHRIRQLAGLPDPPKTSPRRPKSARS